MRIRICWMSLGSILYAGGIAVGNGPTLGPNGVNATNLGLTGASMKIGQVEPFRPGDPTIDPPEYVHTSVDPAAVFRLNGAPNIVDTHQHSLRVAGVMISQLTSLEGVAPGADLYASAFVAVEVDNAMVSIQHIALQSTFAVNHSYGFPLGLFDEPDGNPQLTLGLDWSAFRYNVLHVATGNAVTTDSPVLGDNFNGMTIAASERVGGVWRKVWEDNRFDDDPPGLRTGISLLAPGDGFTMLEAGNTTTTSPHPDGTSYAGPFVTGSVALLQQYAEPRISASQPRWNTSSPRDHRVMKAVLMNSADKLIDDGTVFYPGGGLIPRGRLLGMDRTVLTQTDPMTQTEKIWFESDAYPDQFGLTSSLIPLDEQMGAGHLNVRRALQQFRNGEYDADSSPVPMIGWDFGVAAGTGNVRKYAFNKKLLGGSFISAMLAYDRRVTFDHDGGTVNFFDPGDTFNEYTVFNPRAGDQISDLDLYLVPAGSMSINDAIAISESPDSTIDHIFFQIPSTGNYELWVNQFDADVGDPSYGLAWWAVTSVGDFDADGDWDCNDANALSHEVAIGSTDLAFDMNGDGLVSVLDITDQASGWLTAAGAINTAQTSGLPFLHGDANLNGDVDGTDFNIWNANKFTFNDAYCSGDFTANGVIDGSDYGVWNTNKYQSSATVKIVPEPMNTWVSALMAIPYVLF